MKALRPSVAVLLLACGRSSTAEEPAPSPPPAAPVAFTPRSLEGPALAEWLAAPSKKVRVVNFWATWCPPCLAEMPVLGEVARRHRSGAEVTLVNVDVASAQKGRVPATVRELGVAHLDHVLLQARDPNATLREHVRDWPEQIPVTLVISPDGQVVQRFLQSIEGPELEAAVRKAGARPTPPPG